MADIIPFKGVRYNKEKIIDLSKVIAPPYDVISKEEKAKLSDSSEHNIIRVLLGDDLPGDNESECGTNGFCSMDQDDSYPPDGNRIGDVCDCEGDFDCSGGVDASDVTAFLTDFGRTTFFHPCTNADPCSGDFNCDVNVDATDVTIFLEDFGRGPFFNPCPTCVPITWCAY